MKPDRTVWASKRRGVLFFSMDDETLDPIFIGHVPGPINDMTARDVMTAMIAWIDDGKIISPAIPASTASTDDDAEGDTILINIPSVNL